MKLKDLPGSTNLRGVRFYLPGTKTKVYWFSQWSKGVWYKNNMKDSGVHPLFLDKLSECAEFDIVEDKGGKNGRHCKKRL